MGNPAGNPRKTTKTPKTQGNSRTLPRFSKNWVPTSRFLYFAIPIGLPFNRYQCCFVCSLTANWTAVHRCPFPTSGGHFLLFLSSHKLSRTKRHWAQIQGGFCRHKHSHKITDSKIRPGSGEPGRKSKENDQNPENPGGLKDPAPIFKKWGSKVKIFIFCDSYKSPFLTDTNAVSFVP